LRVVEVGLVQLLDEGALAPKRYELERNSFIALISDLRMGALEFPV